MSSTHKKVIVRKFDRDTVSGYVSGEEFLRGGELEMLNTSGKAVRLDAGPIKAIHFVKEFLSHEEVTRKTFPTKPRIEGLWVRITFTDKEMMEGLMTNELALYSGAGFMITPPDTRGNTQRIFVPRAAVESLQVLAVIGAQSRQRARQVEGGPLLPF
jgi:hypothetical protein